MKNKFWIHTVTLFLLLAVCAPAWNAALQSEYESAKPQGTAGSSLILAKGEGGTIGYVRSVDLEGPEINTPEETPASYPREIPLYSEDGVTVIGTFIAGGAEGGLRQWSPVMNEKS